MSWFSRFRNVVRSDRLSSEIDREMSFHLAERADDLVAKGLGADAAAHEARRRFGNYGIQKERTRDLDIFSWLDTLLSDLRYAVRTLRSAPVFALVAILSLALGVGANTAIFTIVDAVMLRSLPVRHPEELVAVLHDGDEEFTNPLWEQIRDRQDVFGGALAYSTQTFDLGDGGEARHANGSWVSGDFFGTLGVRPVVGRLLVPDDDRRGCPAVAVLGGGFWHSEFGTDENVVGKTLSLDGRPFRIVGVADPAFSGINVGWRDQVYVPLCATALFDGADSRLDQRSNWFLDILARPKSGVTPDQLRARLATLAPAITEGTLPENWPAEAAARYLKMSLTIAPAAKGFSDLRTTYRKALLVLMTIVGLVLLVACANVANLLLARAAARQREIAVRLALGAGRARLARQLITESLLLSLIGAALGLVFALWGSRLLVNLLARGGQNVTLDLAIDMRILMFTTGVAIATGVLFGLAPAWRAGRVDPQSAMKAQGRGLAAGHSRFGAGKALVVAQVALSMVLIAGAGLLLGSWRKLATLDPGFRRDHVLLVTADLGAAAVPPDQRRAAFAQIADRLRTVPGVEAVGVSQLTPIGRAGWNQFVKVDGFAPSSKRDALSWMNAIGGSYFGALGVPVLAGREFDQRDRPGSPSVAIVSRTMARKFFGTTAVVGRHFQLQEGKTYGDPLEIVGVVGDTKYHSLRDSVAPVIYLAASQEASPPHSFSFELRAATPPLSIIPAVKAAIGEVNPRASLDLVPLEQQVRQSLTVMTTVASLSGFFGVLALILATIGLYGIMAYSVARRRNEIGVRIALGAARSRVVRMVLTEVERIVVTGVVLGVGLAWAATRLVATFLYDTKPTDLPTLVASAVTLLVAGVVAAALPAWRASRLDPISALREE